MFEAYGFGHYIETLPNGLRSVSHGGQGNGVMTHFQTVPETGDAIVILTNSQRSWPFIAYLLSDWAQWRAFSRRYGKDYLGPLRTLPSDRCAGVGKSADGIEEAERLQTSKTDRTQTASSWCSGHFARNVNLVRFPEVSVYNFCFPGSVRMAWGLGIRVLRRAAVVRAVTRTSREMRINCHDGFSFGSVPPFLLPDI